MTNEPNYQLFIYYDGECSFCKRSVELIVKYFKIKDVLVAPAQEKAEILESMRFHDSWVIINRTGEKFFTFQGGVEIARHSPILKWFVPLSKPKFMKFIGERVYRLVARNRSRIKLP